MKKSTALALIATLTPDHFAQLTTELSRAQRGLSAMLPEVARAESLEEIRSLATEMVEGYRIYLVVTPQTLLTIASDHGVAISERMIEIAARITEAAERAADAGVDVSEIEALLAAADGLIADGLGLIGPVAETVLSMQPADYPDPAESVMYEAHQNAIGSRTVFGEAASVLREAAGLLREIVRAG